MRQAVVFLAGCGASTVVVSGDPVASPYDGPMSQPVDHHDKATVMERSGPAGRAVECDGRPYNGGSGDYNSGLESVQSNATAALKNWLDNEAWAYQVPATGYRVEREDGGRVLFSYDVGERTKIAFIAAAGVRDYNDDDGWASSHGPNATPPNSRRISPTSSASECGRTRSDHGCQ